MVGLPLNCQRGFALLLFLVVLMGFGGVIGAQLLNGKVKSVNQKKIDHDFEVLRKAKRALLSFVVDYKIDGNDLKDLGRLPNPDCRFGGLGEGVQDGSCDGRHANVSGFLPWKTLGIEVLKDSAGECLWYVVSGDYKGSPKAHMLNEDSNGLLKVQDENGAAYHGANAGDRPIAIIIAPGTGLQGQDRGLADSDMRHCRGNYIESNYLESDGVINYDEDHLNEADDIWTYLYGSSRSRLDNSGFNDKMVWITKNEYWDAVRAQGDLDVDVVGSEIDLLTSDITQCFLDYANDSKNENNWLPWPAAIDLVEYRNDEAGAGVNEYTDTLNPVVLIGRVPQSIANSDAAEFGLSSASQITVPSDMDDIFINCLTAARYELWQNWKDHFFYVVSSDFQMEAGSVLSVESRCAVEGDCVTVGDSLNNIAAIVFYSGSVIDGQSRNSTPVDEDKKGDLANYLDTVSSTKSNAHLYPVDPTYSAAGGDVNKFYDETDAQTSDLAWCIEVGGTSLVRTSCP